MDPPGPSDSQPGPSSPTKAAGYSDAPFRSPKPKITYSDRFIPSRAVSARLDYSILDRETAASETPRRWGGAGGRQCPVPPAYKRGVIWTCMVGRLLSCSSPPFRFLFCMCALHSHQQVCPDVSVGAPDIHPPPPCRTAEKEEGNGAYNMLLRSELLGCPTGARSPEKGSSSMHVGSPTKSPARKLFRYIAGDADTPTAGLPTQSPYARALIGDDSPIAPTLASPKRIPRKIPRSPFKVCTGPGK
jgi:hypothetical protein